MAVTIHEAPIDVNLSGNPIVWVFSSNQTAQTNFSYYVEVYVNGVLHSSHQVFPESGIYGKFDASEIADAYLSAPTIPTDINGVDPIDATIYITVYERYGGTPTLHASATAADVYFIKGKLFINDWINTNLDDYYIDDNTGKKLLTSCPEFNIRSGEKQIISFVMQDANTYGYYVNLVYKDSSGSTVHSEDIANSGYFVENTFMLTYTQLNSYYSLDGVAYVTVTVSEPISAFVSETITINIDNSCAEYTARLHFLNQLGGYDSFTFTQVGRYSASTETKSFLTTQGAFDGASFGWDGLNSQVNNYQVGTNRKLKIESGWISEEVQTWLNNNLFTSPYVLLETSNGLLRVANMSTSVTYNRSKTDMVFNTVIEIDELQHSSMIV